MAGIAARGMDPEEEADKALVGDGCVTGEYEEKEGCCGAEVWG
jgi:hypothetical protein